MSLHFAALNGFRPPIKGDGKARQGRLWLRMARMPVLRIAPKLSAFGGALSALIAAAALLVPLAGVAGANPGPPANLFVVTPGAAIPNPVPCGAVAEVMTPRGFQFPVPEAGGSLAGFRFPGGQVPAFLAELKLLGSDFSSLTLPTPTCGTGSGGVVGE
jgi:hypothetical protein